MRRSILRRLTHHRFAYVCPVLLTLGLGAAGCSGDAPRPNSVEAAALRKAVEERRSITFNRGPRAGNVSASRNAAKGKSSPPISPSNKTVVRTR